jgi:hypothetical protein
MSYRIEMKHRRCDLSLIGDDSLYIHMVLDFLTQIHCFGSHERVMDARCTGTEISAPKACLRPGGFDDEGAKPKSLKESRTTVRKPWA